MANLSEPMGCLDCKKRLAFSRGLCPGCARKQARRIEAHEITDAELVAMHRRAPKKVGWKSLFWLRPNADKES